MLTPPSELKSPSPSLQRILRMLWFGLLALVIVGEVGGIWRTVVDLKAVRAPFASVGLSMAYTKSH